MGKTRRAEAPGGGGAIASLYDKLEHTILPLYYSQPQTYARIMRSTIALNGSFFNTQRMLSQYVLDAYSPKSLASESDLAGAVVKQAGELERSA
jgi:glycogen phosphorylase